ncbi:hypothetical protein EJD97_016113 [Solanum chilense]|uniref:Protein phosphatase n=1 Tax=Solanum chilense TaxID=4083 RepID=A0A6N2BAN8_SOLCI|nr:hypothetical protein EJD97_016113 [Solanum chilense]
MAAYISSLGHDQYSSINFDELFNLPRYKRYLDFTSHQANDQLENHSNKKLKLSQDNEFVNVEKRVVESSNKELLPCLKIMAGSVYIPKDNPKKPLGDDANFIHELYQTIGVADGVGGWAKHGIDAGIYARELMKNSHIATDSEAMKGHVNPKRVLEEAYRNTHSKGSSTACIISLNSERSSIVAANVGDSGFLLIRKGKIIYKSPIQQRGYGCPYQLGNCKDNPSVAHEMELNVEMDDILMAGTDGMLDNMNDSEIEEIVQRAINNKLKPKELAKKIANIALYNSFDRYADTPYARASKGRHRGGKVDDITVIVAYIQ